MAFKVQALSSRGRILLLLIVIGAVISLFDATCHLLRTTRSLAKPEMAAMDSSYHMRKLNALRSNPFRMKVDALFKQAKDQITIANAYAFYVRKSKLEMMKEARLLTEQAEALTKLINRPQNQALLAARTINNEHLKAFEAEFKKCLKSSKQLIAEAKEYFDSQLRVQKLKDAIFSVNDHLTKAKRQGAFASLIAAKSIPQSLNCLSTRLMEERISNPSKYVDTGDPAPQFEDPSLYHYAIFSDNVLAASVVVKSAVANAKQPEKHVFHVVTDKMNLWAMRVWFKMRSPNNATHIEVKAVEDYPFLNASYVPVLRQLESANLQKFYFENQMENATKDAPNMKFRNPKYLSMMNHLRFYLAEMYPKLHKILFLDDDVVVQKDLTDLWELNLEGKVNAAVETCFGSFHRYDNYMNFSHPLIKERMDPKACAWAYGMNLFDLDAWRRERCTEEYHFWQKHNENRLLWKLGTLPPGLITYYRTTKPINKSWHVLGLGYNPSIDREKIESAAVIHYNGNMKPWLDLAMKQYKHYWTRYVDYEMEFVQSCNFGR